jgi:photosystem II stability/assembly factor-like uncharacterized protein
MVKKPVQAMLGSFMLIVLVISAPAQWVKTNWPASNNYFKLSASQSRVFARTWDSLNGGRTFLTADQGATWTPISSADSSIGILSVVMVNNTIIAGTWNGFFRSTTSGTSWNAVTPAGIPADSAIWSISMVNTTLFAGARGTVYKSSDSGTTWTEVKTGIPTGARITSLVASGSAIYAGSDSNGVFLTTNGGTSWTAINSGLTDKHIFNLAVMGTRVFAATLNGVFISGNSGTSWAANGSSLKNINCFVVADKQLYVGTDSSGVYLSVDSGATWTSFNSGMTAAGTRVWSLVASGDNIFAGTSSGVWRNPVLVTAAESRERAAQAVFTGLRYSRLNSSRAEVVFALPAPETVEIGVYDLCGNKIRSLVHQRFGAGPQSFSFNTGLIARGSYIIRLTTGSNGYQQTVPIVR